MKIIQLSSELHIDTESDAAYLYLNTKEWNDVNYTSSLLEDDGSNINIDYDNNWKVIWIEFIPASKIFKI